MSNITFEDFIRLVKSDQHRYRKPFLYCLIVIPGFRYTYHHRLCYFLSSRKWLYPLYIFERLCLRHLSFKYGIEIGRNMKLSEGFCIAHFGGIVFFPKSCGKNCFLRPGVVVGTATGYGTDESPIIGDNVKFGVHSCVLGGVKISDNVVIAAGAVVVKDVPANCVVAGVPAKIIHYLNEEQ